MTDYDNGSEPQRVLGFPVKRGEHGQSWRDKADSSQHIFGLPSDWWGSMRSGRPMDTRWLAHPGRWLRWRAQVRRLGPYAPDFDELGPRAPRRPKQP